ncbi:hypothetical protein B7494_g3354 [Chlorociboria aeruginascens]|nr:hypothetical protein B7494_g3354 [Chlorociboria aeruginascens]
MSSHHAYISKPFFFYGTLTDPLRLQDVLQLPTPRVLKPARVTSLKIMLWGQYPALVNGPHNSYVDGVAYLVETKEQQDMLEYCNTDIYNPEGVLITVEEEVVARRTSI